MEEKKKTEYRRQKTEDRRKPVISNQSPVISKEEERRGNPEQRNIGMMGSVGSKAVSLARPSRSGTRATPVKY
jgi:hypothetical protein